MQTNTRVDELRDQNQRSSESIIKHDGLPVIGPKLGYNHALARLCSIELHVQASVSRKPMVVRRDTIGDEELRTRR